jgi:CheY-like chemotaxis protein
LRTPLTSIQLAANELKFAEEKMQQETLLQVISVSADGLLALINDMLDLGTIVAGKMVLHPALFDVKELLDEVKLVLTPFANRKRMEVKIDFQMPSNCVVNLDRARLRQVLLNLGSNAIKYSNRDVSFWVSLLNNDRELCVKVIDSGPGISPEAIGKLFLTFSRLEPQDAESHQYTSGGTGLGLCIAKQIVNLMGGTIGVTSQLGQGSVFYFSVPVEPRFEALKRPKPSTTISSISTDEMEQQLAALTPSAVMGVGEARGSDGATAAGGVSDADFMSFQCAKPLDVLVVDDTLVNLRLMERTLTRLGVNVTTAASGPAALELARGHAFDLVLLDFFMPEMTGAQTCALLRAMPAYADVPIVCVTASERPTEEVGFTGFLFKPFSATQFEALIDKCETSKADAANQPAQRNVQEQREGFGGEKGNV